MIDVFAELGRLDMALAFAGRIIRRTQRRRLTHPPALNDPMDERQPFDRKYQLYS
jgi:hypothetical protein